MNVLGHHDVACDHEPTPRACTFERILKEVACFRGGQIRSAVETTEGDEMEVSGVVVSDESSWHRREGYTASRTLAGLVWWSPRSQKRDLGHPLSEVKARPLR